MTQKFDIDNLFLSQSEISVLFKGLKSSFVILHCGRNIIWTKSEITVKRLMHLDLHYSSAKYSEYFTVLFVSFYEVHFMATYRQLIGHFFRIHCKIQQALMEYSTSSSHPYDCNSEILKGLLQLSSSSRRKILNHNSSTECIV